MNVNSNTVIKEAYRFSIAPMMDCTDRHFRVLMRQISKRSLLYTEMIVAQGLHYCENKKRFLGFDEVEHPISLQIGGDDPVLLSEASRIAEDWGYDEINLNVGCPSPRVKAGNFGACLMADSHQVATCIEAMVKATKIPVTIKHRIGIDNFDNYSFLLNFVDDVASAGAERFAIHARKAFLKGLNPKQNREIPPLEYEKVEKLKKERPQLKIELNGGLQNIENCMKALEIFDGVMVGRAIYKQPLLWQKIDEIIYGEKPMKTKASKIIKNLLPYTEKYLNENGSSWGMCRHLLKLIEGFKGAKSMREEISIISQQKKSDISFLKKIAQQLEDAGL
tara:strand:+ start:1056 stop:2060 length:1005 start_codon:yes stop_codon:yes gene_type:complete